MPISFRARPARASLPPDLIVAAASAAVYATLGVSAQKGLLDDVNNRVRDVMLRRGPRTVRVARTITLLSESAVHPVLGYLLSKVSSRVNGRPTHAPLIASLADFVVNKGTRLVVHQERPPGAKPRHGLDRLGYPSGHTLAATAIAFATALEIGDGRRTAERTALFVAASAYAAAIGWTRLTLDEHWIDDVIGGCAGGIALALLLHRADLPRRLGGPRIRR